MSQAFFVACKHTVIYYNSPHMSKYIISNPNIMGGEPVIKGTRTPVEVILYRLKEGNSIKAIHDSYPWIDEQTLSGAIDEITQLVKTTFHTKVDLYPGCMNSL